MAEFTIIEKSISDYEGTILIDFPESYSNYQNSNNIKIINCRLKNKSNNRIAYFSVAVSQEFLDRDKFDIDQWIIEKATEGLLDKGEEE